MIDHYKRNNNKNKKENYNIGIILNKQKQQTLTITTRRNKLLQIKKQKSNYKKSLLQVFYLRMFYEIMVTKIFCHSYAKYIVIELKIYKNIGGT